MTASASSGTTSGRCAQPLAALLLTVLIPLGAADTWQPHEHPAVLHRTIYGFTAPVQQMALAAEFPARIAAISVDRGDRIAVDDQPAVQLDDAVARLRLERARAARDAAQAAVEAAAAQVALARRDHAWQTSEVDRITDLAAANRVPQRDLDQARYARDRSALTIDQLAATQATAEARLAESEQAVAEAADHLARHRLQAPRGWQVVDRHAQSGSVIGAGVPILDLVDCRVLRVDLRLAEAELAALRHRESIELTFPDSPDSPSAAAALHRIDPRFDPVSKKRLVELRLPGEAAPSASGGLPVALRLALPDPNGLVAIPDRFVQRRLELYRVRTDAGDWLPIEPLRRSDDTTFVAGASLPPGLTLVIPEADG